MATILRAQVNIPNDVDIPANVAMNTWHFWSRSVDPLTDATAIITGPLTAFYGVFDQYMSLSVSTPATVKVYDLTDPAPRVPLWENTIALTPSASAQMPNEVAVCLSYHGTPVSGGNPARTRGRLYLGPVATNVGAAGTGDYRVGATPRGNIATAAEAVAEYSAAGDFNWCVFSPTTAGAEPWSEEALEAAMVLVTGGYIDDSFDTVRSRGLAPSARTSFTAVLP